LGINLARKLAESGYGVHIISRNPPKESGNWKHKVWDANTLGDWIHELDGAKAVVNLAGRSVDCVKTPDNCDVILRSRVQTTQLIGQAVRQIKSPPPIWVQMSTAHIYGDSPHAVCTEDSTFGYGFSPFVGQAWEDAYEKAVLPNMRKVILRTSFVLGRSGGALTRLSLLARLGLGGKVGDGRQGISWLHEEDMDRLFIRAITNEEMQGVYIATAPNPVSNATFMRQLRKAVGMPFGMPSNAWMVKFGASLFLKSDPELALYGRYVVSDRLKAEGFQFSYPEIGAALQNIYAKN